DRRIVRPDRDVVATVRRIVVRDRVAHEELLAVDVVHVHRHLEVNVADLRVLQEHANVIAVFRREAERVLEADSLGRLLDEVRTEAASPAGFARALSGAAAASSCISASAGPSTGGRSGLPSRRRDRGASGTPGPGIPSGRAPSTSGPAPG